MPHNVLQISDCHLVVEGSRLIGVDTQASLDAVLAQALSEQQVDVIIATGDLAHDPLPEVYARFLSTVRRYFDGPLLCLPGNHDVLEKMQIAQLPMAGISLGSPPASWALIGLDSHEDELPAALVDEGDRSRLMAQMQAHPDAHVLVATHHPLLDVDCPWLDCDRIKNSEELVRWMCAGSDAGRGSRVRSVVHGHAHQEVTGSCENVPVFGAPSTCFQFKPRSPGFAVDDLGPGYRWLYLHDDGQISTEVSRVTGFTIAADVSQVQIGDTQTP